MKKSEYGILVINVLLVVVVIWHRLAAYPALSIWYNIIALARLCSHSTSNANVNRLTTSFISSRRQSCTSTATLRMYGKHIHYPSINREKG